MKIGNDNSVRYGFARDCFNKPFTLSEVEWFIFYLCSCLSTQFLYRTDIKATFNVKDNINIYKLLQFILNCKLPVVFIT